MPTSSDNQTPSLTSDSAKQLMTTDWKGFSTLVAEAEREDFAIWLDEELVKLENKLEQFVTDRSRYSGRR
jgi:hypothetical protein